MQLSHRLGNKLNPDFAEEKRQSLMKNSFTRRQWLQTMSGTGLLCLAQPAKRDLSKVHGHSSLRDAARVPSLYTLETSQQVDRGGPILATRDGRILWFTIEPEAPYLSPNVWPLARVDVRECSGDCKSWGTPQTIVQGTREYSVLSHVALQLKSGDLIHIHVRFGGYDHIGHDPEKSSNPCFIQRSSDGGKSWSDSVLLPTAERYISDVLSITQISTGRVIYPFGFLSSEKGRFKVSVLYSDDEARTWKRSPHVLEVGGNGFESGASEPSVVELSDRRLWMLIRAQSGFLWQSFSDDQGRTWEEARPSRLPSSNAPGTALRLSSGRVVVVWNNHVDSAYARQSLVIASTEDGRTFSGFREIDHTNFAGNPEEPVPHVTYPFLAEAPDGDVLVSYNQGFWLRHNHAKVARVAPSWIDIRREFEDFRNGRVGWCSTNPGTSQIAAVELYAPAEDNEPGASLDIEQPAGSNTPCGVTRNMPLLGEGEMKLTLSVLKPEGYVLWHDSLLPPGRITEACLRVRFSQDGSMFLAAGVPTRTGKERKGLAYSYLAYPIMGEQRYPQPIVQGKRFILSLRFSVSLGKAFVRINDGQEVAIPTPPILGLCHFGVAVATGGAIRLRRFESIRS